MRREEEGKQDTYDTYLLPVTMTLWLVQKVMVLRVKRLINRS